jgi:hypothetical protein
MNVPDTVGGSTAKPPGRPVQTDRPHVRGVGDLIVVDVVGHECAGVDVAQHEIGRTGCVSRGDAGVSGKSAGSGEATVPIGVKCRPVEFAPQR